METLVMEAKVMDPKVMEPDGTLIYEFTNRTGPNPTKIESVTFELKHPAAVAGLLISLFAGLVAALLWLLPKPFTRFEYMIAGTSATALTLLVVFIILTPGVAVTFRRMFRKHGIDPAGPSPNPAANPSAKLRTVRRSEQSS